MFKDNEKVELLKAIDKKFDIIISMYKADKIKKASKNSENGGAR